MLETLYKYLALHKKLSIPGIGNFVVEETPATLNFTDKLLHAPTSYIKFRPVVQPTNNHFYTFLSREWQVDKVIAIRMYKEEVETLLHQVQTLGMCQLPGIGVLRKQPEGTIVFSAVEHQLPLYSSLPAQRVMRKHAQHTVLVGEEQQIKTHTQPTVEETKLQQEEEREAKDVWWIYALIIAVIAILVIVYYYSSVP